MPHESNNEDILVINNNERNKRREYNLRESKRINIERRRRSNSRLDKRKKRGGTKIVLHKEEMDLSSKRLPSEIRRRCIKFVECLGSNQSLMEAIRAFGNGNPLQTIEEKLYREEYTSLMQFGNDFRKIFSFHPWGRQQLSGIHYSQIINLHSQFKTQFAKFLSHIPLFAYTPVIDEYTLSLNVIYRKMSDVFQYEQKNIHNSPQLLYKRDVPEGGLDENCGASYRRENKESMCRYKVKNLYQKMHLGALCSQPKGHWKREGIRQDENIGELNRSFREGIYIERKGGPRREHIYEKRSHRVVHSDSELHTQRKYQTRIHSSNLFTKAKNPPNYTSTSIIDHVPNHGDHIQRISRRAGNPILYLDRRQTISSFPRERCSALEGPFLLYDPRTGGASNIPRTHLGATPYYIP